jgi:uncharacterized protein (DUF488 family)
MTHVSVISIGYERRTVAELVELLVAHGVKKLIDVREMPLSRRPAFNKNRLAPEVSAAGIVYQHLRVAGNPYRKEATNVFDCLGRYASYLHEHPDIVELVADELSTTPVAMLCYERQHVGCHRSVLLRELQRHGYSIDIVEVEDYAISMATQAYLNVGEDST